jgi:hypothetical protein
MDTKQRADVFINVHKGLRRGLLGLALKIGQVDWADEAEVKLVGGEFATLLHFLREHAANEDDIQFPLLEERVPGATAREQEDHRKLEKELDQLEKDLAQTLQSPDRLAPGYRLYMGFNRFLSGYLAHMDREENEVTGAFYRHFTDDEIEAGFKKIIARTPPADVAMMLGYMLPAMNGEERFTFLYKMGATAPPEVFGKVKGLAQKALVPKDWEKLSSRLG